MVSESWFRSLWKISRKHDGSPEKVRIGVLAFEVASLMSKLVHQWNSLSDNQITKLREEIASSVGIKKLVSDDDEHIVDLICAEMLQNLETVARAVGRLAKKCSDPLVRSFERAFDELIKIGADQYGWLFTWKKMSRKVKKMERFVLVNANLYQEMETLTELEQILRRMKSNEDQESIILVEYEKKAAWKKHEVKRLKEISLWNRTYDYIVLLLARSVFTIFGRIGHVFGIYHVLPPGIEDSRSMDSDFIHRSQSVSSMLQSSVHPSENRIIRFSSGPLGNLITKSGSMARTNMTNNFYSGPLGNSTTHSRSISQKHKSVNFYSGPIGKSTSKSGPLPKAAKSGLRLWQTRDSSLPLQGKSLTPNRLSAVGPFKGRMIGGNSSPVRNCYVNSNTVSSVTIGEIENSGGECHASVNLLHGDLTFSSKQRNFKAPPGSLGAAALALHYANVIIVLEKLVASPHLIGHDARDDLYNMLPASVRTALRARLKPYAKSLASSVYDTVLAEEWTEAMTGILEWLAPLAHNMIRWQSERSFEHQNLLSRTNVLLVQTLYYANQEKTEATITELLVGLNYIWRFGRELNAKALMECESGRMIDNCLSLEG